MICGTPKISTWHNLLAIYRAWVEHIRCHAIKSLGEIVEG